MPLLGVPGVAVTKLLASHLWRTRVLQIPPVPEVEPTVGEVPPVDDPKEKTTPGDVGG